jgi:hypothetical protein
MTPVLPLALLAALLAGCSTQPADSTAAAATAPGEWRFSGTIEAVDDGCLADGVCSLTIAGREVVWMVGWSRETWGRVLDERRVGTPVEVWCRRTASGCELRGNAEYYVRAAR